MDIKTPRRDSALTHAARRFWRDRRAVTIAVYTLLVLVAGAAIHRSRIPQRAIAWGVHEIRFAPRLIRARMADPEHITIDIKHQDYIRLATKRQEALATGVLISSDDDFVPATIRYGDETLRVKLRLKGDLSDHWDTNRWSFRVEVKDDRSLFGMKQFSLQHPKTRNYLFEWFYHRALRREGLIALRYDFIDVTLNGERLGTYAIEEHFEKRLIENNRRREGPILRFNEDLSWAELLRHNDLSMSGTEHRAGAGSWLASEIDVFQTNRWLADSTMQPLYLKAINLLEGFRDGRLSASDVFDIDQLGRFFAINEIIGTQHGSNWRNIRFYYNPVTGRLEPIGFDTSGGDRLIRLAITVGENGRLDPQMSWYHGRFWELIFQDEAVRESYLGAIERMSDPAYLGSFLDSIAPDVATRLNIIRRDNPEVEFDTSILRGNVAYLHRMLYPVRRVNAWVRPAGDSVRIDVANIQALPIDITGVRIAGRDEPLSSPIRFEGRSDSSIVRYTSFTVPLPRGTTWSDSIGATVRVASVVPGTGALVDDVVSTVPRPTGEIEVDPVHALPDPDAFPFLLVNEEERSIDILPGNWTVNRDMILPAGYVVRAGAGVHVRLVNGANIITHSRVEFLGSPENPVLFDAPDSTGGGLAVLAAHDRSRIEYTTFHNLGFPDREGWTLTGAVTFYESPVEIVNTVFQDNRSEDALNIIRSQFHIEESTFARTFGDALDVDFGDGTVLRSRFTDIGNDAVDVSGTVVRVTDVDVDGAGDKGVSVGENSNATIADSRFTRTNVGIASKDLSHAFVQNCVITGAHFGFAAYRKKPEFGGGNLLSSRTRLVDVPVPFLRDAESTITVNGAASGQPSTDVLHLVDPA